MLDNTFNLITEDDSYIYFNKVKKLKSELTVDFINNEIERFQIKVDW